MLDQFASQTVVTVLNRLLAREAWARDRLAPFAGRIARIDIAPLSLTLAVVEGGRLEVAAGAPNVTIAIDLAAAPGLLLEPAALMRNVRLSGDAEFAQALSFVLQNLRPEPEEELARFVGDAAAVRLVGLLRSALAQAREGGERLVTSAVDYFVAENPMLVGRADVESFARDVHAARDAVERLAKRIARLEAAASGAGGHDRGPGG